MKHVIVRGRPPTFGGCLFFGPSSYSTEPVRTTVFLVGFDDHQVSHLSAGFSRTGVGCERFMSLDDACKDLLRDDARVVLVDLTLEEDEWLPLIPAIQRRFPGTLLLCVGAERDPARLVCAHRLGLTAVPSHATADYIRDVLIALGSAPPRRSLEWIKREIVEHDVRWFGPTETARLLGMSRSTLYRLRAQPWPRW